MAQLQKTESNILLIAIFLSLGFFGAFFFVIMGYIDLAIGIRAVLYIVFFLAELTVLLLLLIFGVWKRRR